MSLDFYPMNASQLAEMLERQSSLSEAEQEQCAEILRRQHEAIVKLRGVLESIHRMSYDNSAQAKTCAIALADTEEICKSE